MSTRGFIGFVADGTEKIAYNHCDSYPSGLGVDVLTWLRDTLTTHGAVMIEQVKNLRVVDGEAEPTDAEIEQFRNTTNRSVGGRSDRPTWYQLLRNTQGNPAAILAAGAIEDASHFPGDSLFAEYGYVVDTDARQFEAYAGFQGSPHSKGRFAGRAPASNGYHPVALAASWSFDALPTDHAFLVALGETDEEA